MPNGQRADGRKRIGYRASVGAEPWQAYRDGEYQGRYRRRLVSVEIAPIACLAGRPFAFGSTYANWQDASEARWRQRFQDRNAVNLVADRNGSLVGMAGGIPGEHPQTIELVSMWVEPSARGTGVADSLIASVEEWASARVKELWLADVPTNDRAFALYTRHGFKPVDEVGDPLPDGSGHEILMKKALNPPSQ